MLERGWNTNPDGGGYAYINEHGAIVTVKSMDKDDFILRYLEDHIKYGETSDFVVHMRIATHGSITLANNHPFTVPVADGYGQTVIMHNGIINNMDAYCKGTDITDTQALVEAVIGDLDDRWLDNEYIVEFIEDFIDYSKLVFLTTNPLLSDTMYVLNEDFGVERDGVWFSNYALFEYKTATVGKYGSDWDTWALDDTLPFGYDRHSVAYYDKNGKYCEGDYSPQKFTERQARNTDAQAEDWEVHSSERSVNALELSMMDNEQHVDAYNASLLNGDVCSICTGKVQCLCNDLCFHCYEDAFFCMCLGDFDSISDAIEQNWSQRVNAIIKYVAEGSPEEREENVATLVVT